MMVFGNSVKNEHRAQAGAPFSKRAPRAGESAILNENETYKLDCVGKMCTALRRERNFRKKSAPRAGESAGGHLQT